MVKRTNLPRSGTTSDVGGIISASRRKNTVSDSKIEIDRLTCNQTIMSVTVATPIHFLLFFSPFFFFFSYRKDTCRNKRGQGEKKKIYRRNKKKRERTENEGEEGTIEDNVNPDSIQNSEGRTLSRKVRLCHKRGKGEPSRLSAKKKMFLSFVHDTVFYLKRVPLLAIL